MYAKLTNRKTAVYAQALYGVSQGLLYPIMALIFYVGSRWLLDGRYTTSEFFVVLIAVVSRSLFFMQFV